MYLGNDDGDGWLRCHKSAGHFSETAKGRPAHDYLSSQPSPMTAEKWYNTRRVFWSKICRWSIYNTALGGWISLYHVIRHGESVWQHTQHSIAYHTVCSRCFLLVSLSYPMCLPLETADPATATRVCVWRSWSNSDRVPPSLPYRNPANANVNVNPRRWSECSLRLGLNLASSLGLWIPKQSEEEDITGILVGQGENDPSTKDVIVTCYKSRGC